MPENSFTLILAGTMILMGLVLLAIVKYDDYKKAQARKKD